MPPTPDETEAAAGRLRRLAAGEAYGDTYDDCDSTEGEDRRTLADAWLADHPADDGDEIDAAWLDTLGATDDPARRLPWLWRLNPAGDSLAVRAAASGWVCSILPGDSARVSLPSPTTRGQLRRLLAALGAGLPAGGGL